MTSYEGATQVFDTTHKHAVNLIGGTDRYDCDAAGNMTKRNKGLCGSSNSLATDHTFTGQKYDSSGLQFFNARYYDPQGAH